MAEPETTSLEDLGGWPAIFSKLFSREDLSETEASAAFTEILSGSAEQAQIAAFAASLRTKGETVEEMTGMVASARRAGERVVLDGSAIDTCGTGGDRSGTINVSTVAALIAAGAGATVCKHGNRAASSRSGSADVLEALGVVIDLGPNGVARCVSKTGIGFCFAQRFHPALRFAAPARSAIKVATTFNFLGPLANPARVSRQAIGVGDTAMAEKMLGVLERGGIEHAMVFYGHDGLDELSTAAPSQVFETRLMEDGSRLRREFVLDATTLGLKRAAPEELRGGDAAHNARRVHAILDGEHGRQRDLVVLNAAAALIVAGLCEDFAAGVALAEATLDGGRPAEVLESFIAVSKTASSEGVD